jgi:hypothetical protein
MSNPTIIDKFTADEGADTATLRWKRASDDVPGAEIVGEFTVTGLSEEQRAKYLIDIRQALAGLRGWGGGDY